MNEHTYAAAYVKSLEGNMLTDNELENMLSFSEEELKERLAAIGYEGEDIPDMLENEEQKVRKLCIELCEDDSIRRVMLARTDFHNIKAVLKAVFAGRNAASLIESHGSMDTQELIRAVKDNDFCNMDKNFAKTCEDAYRLYKKTQDSRRLEEYLDHQQILYVLNKSDKNKFVHGWAKLYADLGKKKEYMQNEKETNALQEGENEDFFKESPSEFSKYCDNRLTEYLKAAQFSFFGFDSVFAYYEAKQIEIKNLRLILYGSRTGNREEAAKRLRRSYV